MNFLVPDKVYEINGVTVKDYLLTEHNPYNIELPQKRKKQLLGVTIHNTEAIRQADGTTMAEQYTRATIYGNMGLTRVHFYVDDVEAWRNLPDNWCGWHAADGSGDGNTATIAIEVIGKTAKAEENAAKLAAGLLKANGLPADALYTHTHWLNVKAGKTGTREYLNTLHNVYKNCPAYILPHWSEFEEKVRGCLKDIVPAGAVNRTVYRVQIGAFSDKENAEQLLEKAKGAGFSGFITEQETEQEAEQEAEPKKPIEEVAREVIRGEWGNGNERKERLTGAGYDYEKVQAKVEEILEK